jgi:hypothetical protein
MVDVSLILKAFSVPVSMIPSQNSGTTPQPGKASIKKMSSHFRLFPYSYHVSSKLSFFVHANAAEGKSARIAFLSRTKVN